MMRIRIASLMLSMVLGITLGVGTTYAQEGKPDYLEDKPTTLPRTKREPGWYPMLKLSANTALGHSHKVVGSPDGYTFTLGAHLKGGLDYRHKDGHLWTSKLDWQVGYSRTPTIDRFIKNLDLLMFSTAYMYYIQSVPWLGPYAKFSVQTAAFDGYEVKAEDVVVRKLDKDGNEISSRLVKGEQKIPLTKGFAPTTFRESVGIFAEPVDIEPVKVTFQLGVGAWQTLVRDGFVVQDDEDTDELEIKRMQDNMELGAELNIYVEGLWKKWVSYGAKAEFMYPFYHSADTDLEGIDLLNMNFELHLGLKLLEFASLDYTLKAFKHPVIVDEWQVMNGLLLSITANFF